MVLGRPLVFTFTVIGCLVNIVYRYPGVIFICAIFVSVCTLLFKYFIDKNVDTTAFNEFSNLPSSHLATKQSPSGNAASAVDVQETEESSASEYEEIIEEVTDYSEAESDVQAEVNVKSEKAPIKEVPKKEEEKSSSSIASTTETTSSAVEQSKKEEVVSETETKSEVKIVSETITETEIVEEEQESNEDVVKVEQGESLNAQVVHDTDKPATQNMLKEAANLNDKKLKSAQTILNSKATSSESSSMQAPFNSKVHKTSTSVSSSSSSQNPVVTVQTAGRTDSNVMHKNSNSNSNNNSSSSLGGNSVVVGNDSPRQVDRLGVPQKEDSGTESGEDLRLIAAGLRDQLQIQSDANIIEDVTGALSRLENSLKEGKDITVDSEKRKALLALVDRLRAGLTSPEKLAEIAAAMSSLDGGEGLYGETSSPEADAHRSNRSRFAKRRNRVSRHTVGVSREELADARRYMEDMLIMGNKSQSNTPDVNSINNNVPPQWYPIEKNASMGAMLTETAAPILQRPKQFVPDDNSNSKFNNNKLTATNNKRRPLSGEYSVTFEPTIEYKQELPKARSPPKERSKQNSSPDDNSRNSRFSNKKHLMKRANTIDLAKTHKYNSEFDTDSDAEDKQALNMGLKRAVQVSVKKRVQNVVPPFEPKTENDRKFLAFINKQSDKPGLGWTSSRSVSNWTNKFGSIKSTFEGGLKGKPPQVPHHNTATKSNPQVHKLYQQQPLTTTNRNPQPNYVSNQQIAQRLQQEAQRQAEERRRHLERERERLEYERREREKLERQRQQREMQERERLEREHFERQRREQDQITASQHAAILREQQQIAASQQNVPKPLPINEFKHAPQSVFRPIDTVDAPVKPIYKPIPQMPRNNASSWQSVNPTSTRGQGSSSLNASPSQYGNTRPDASFITSPPPSSRSPIGLPWASKPTVDNSSFKTKAHRFEEASKYDNIQSAGPYLQRHNSLRSSNGTSSQISEDFRKRPSLPNTFDPYSVNQMSTQQDPLAYLPPPQNISFTYSNPKSKVNYQSYPCLPLAVSDNSMEKEYQRPRESSLTDPHSVPLVLTSTNPSYCPASANASPQQQQQQQQLSQSRVPPPRQFDLVSPGDSLPASPSVYNTLAQTDYTDDDLDSDTNLLEYHAVSRVMGNPQTAVTVGRRTGHVSDDELYGKNSRAAKNLLSTMKSMGNKNGNGKPKQSVIKRPEKVTSPKLCLSPDGRSYQAPIVEPLFPEINKFEPNRKPVFLDQEQSQNKPATPQAAAAAPRKQMGMYKSMESLNRNVNIGPYKQQPSPKPYVSQTPPIQQSNFEQQPLFHSNQTNYQGSQQQQPYVSETQTSYVVTYPVEDTTDDEDFSRQSSRKMPPPQTLDLSRQRKVSEASTTSSTTATSISYSHNLPSPNTSWTSNPVLDESSSYQPPRQQAVNKNVAPQSYTEPTYQAHSSLQVNRNYTTLNQPPPQTQQQYEAPLAQTKAEQKSIPPTKTSYETQTQRQLQEQISQNAYEKQNQVQPKTEQRTQKSTYEAQTQRQLQQQTVNQKQISQIQPQSHKTQKPITTQKLSLPATNQQTTKTSAQTTTTVSQEKRSLINMRKTLSEDHSHADNITRDQTVLNPQNSNISQEMLDRLEQQRERISNEMRRKSLGNALDYQMEKQARFETQQQQQQEQDYKSSAPADTPDIVKSSLPKDENQPILKKFGPPQRHHYMPNSYQNPSVNSVTSTSSRTMATSAVSTNVQNKNMQQHTAASHTTVVKTKQQQVVTNTRPTVMETPATPQPDDDYIPRNIVYNNVHAFSSMSRRQDDESVIAAQEQHHHSTQLRPNKLSKSDSWNQIVMLQNQNNQMHMAPKHNASPTNELRRTKSGHTLALPKMYEAAMTKTDITEKQKTVQAYFSGQKSPTQQEMLVEQQQQHLTSSTKRSVINRTKTSEKVSAASRKSLGSNLPIVQGGLTRSATMPHIANLNLLDESNVEDAFEQLIMGS